MPKCEFKECKNEGNSNFAFVDLQLGFLVCRQHAQELHLLGNRLYDERLVLYRKQCDEAEALYRKQRDEIYALVVGE